LAIGVFADPARVAVVVAVTVGLAGLVARSFALLVTVTLNVAPVLVGIADVTGAVTLAFVAVGIVALFAVGVAVPVIGARFVARTAILVTEAGVRVTRGNGLAEAVRVTVARAVGIRACGTVVVAVGIANACGTAGVVTFTGRRGVGARRFADVVDVVARADAVGIDADASGIGIAFIVRGTIRPRILATSFLFSVPRIAVFCGVQLAACCQKHDAESGEIQTESISNHFHGSLL
jgi:hypothetical protein